MQAKWLIRKNRRILLLFFNGWGMDQTPFLSLTSREWDVLTLFDYRTLSIPEAVLGAAACYAEVKVLAWSMGVWAAHAVRRLLPPSLTDRIALNGTLLPIHPRLGIPPGLFSATLENFTPATRDQFYANMFSSQAEHRRFLAHAPVRPLAEQAEELLRLWERLHPGPDHFSEEVFFSRVGVGRRDRIFPYANQHRFWKNRCPMRTLDSDHFAFHTSTTWEELFFDESLGQASDSPAV